MRVLVIRLGAFGDIIHTLPLAADLHAAGHQVDWLAEDRWTCILEENPAIDRVFSLPAKWLRGPGRRVGLAALGERLARLRNGLRAIRGRDYDGVIDAQGLAKSSALALLAGGGVSVGHGHGRARELLWRGLDRTISPTATHVIDQQRALAGALDPVLGRTAGTAWRFPLPAWPRERRAMAAWLADQGLERPWLLNVGAGWPTKVWPVERHAELLGRLAARGQGAVVLWGSPAEQEVARRAVELAGHGTLAPATTIPELAGLLLRARILVSGDTGPLHLALALATPAIGLFGPVPAGRNGPRGPGYHCLQAPGAAWERRDVTKVDMGAISASAVADAADLVLGEIDSKR